MTASTATARRRIDVAAGLEGWWKFDEPSGGQAAGYTTQTNDRRIGAAEVTDNNWNGMIDDVRIYDHALSNNDVATLFSVTCD